MDGGTEMAIHERVRHFIVRFINYGNSLDYNMDSRCLGGAFPLLLRWLVAEDLVLWLPICSTELCFITHCYFSHPVRYMEGLQWWVVR